MACARGGKNREKTHTRVTSYFANSQLNIPPPHCGFRAPTQYSYSFTPNKTGASLAIPSLFDHLGLIMAASVLSMESPPFQPRISGSGGSSAGGSSFASPGHHRIRSGASSPLSHGSMGGEAYSNAVRSYSFQTPSGYVCLYVLQFMSYSENRIMKSAAHNLCWGLRPWCTTDFFSHFS